MIEARYHELLGQLLDGSLSDADAEELRSELEENPARLRDVREQLMLSEALSQAQTPQRGVEPFWAGVQARLGSEAEGEPATQAMAKRGGPRDPNGRYRWSREIGIAAAVLLTTAVVVRWVGPRWDAVNVRRQAAVGHPPRTSEGRLIALRGEAVCTHCILHQTPDCCPAVRYRKGGREETLVLSDNAVSRGLKLKSGCCRRPMPVIAEGTIRIENGRQLLVATRLEVQR